MFTSNFTIRTEGYYPPEISMGKYSDHSGVLVFLPPLFAREKYGWLKRLVMSIHLEW